MVFPEGITPQQENETEKKLHLLPFSSLPLDELNTVQAKSTIEKVENPNLLNPTVVDLKVIKQGKKYDYEIGIKMTRLLGILPIVHPTTAIRKRDLGAETSSEESKQTNFETLFAKAQHLNDNFGELNFGEHTKVKIAKNTEETLISIDYEGKEPNTNIHISSVDGFQQVIISKEGQNDVLQIKKGLDDTERKVGTDDGILSTMTDEEINTSIFSKINERFDYAIQKSEEAKQETDDYLKTLAYKEQQEKDSLENPASLYT